MFVYRREKFVTGGEGVAQPVAAKDTGHSVRLEEGVGFQFEIQRGIKRLFIDVHGVSGLVVILFSGKYCQLIAILTPRIRDSCC